MMKAKLIIASAAILIAAGTSAAFAYDITSDPDATITQEQKLGPNVRSHRVGNAIVTNKTGRYHRHAYYRYGRRL
jgi:hypothetical protein